MLGNNMSNINKICKSKVAVLMSTYNAEEYLKVQLDSIFSQKGNFEIDLIVRDDGSCDNTLSIIEDYRNKFPIKIYSGENIGPSKSFFTLVLNTNGYDYYAFADQDDYWYNNKIEKLISKIEVFNKPALVFCNAELVDENLYSLHRNVKEYIPYTDFYSVSCLSEVQGCTMLWNENFSKVLRDCGMPNTMTMHDSWLMRVITAIGGDLSYFNEALLKYRQHSKNTIGFKLNIYYKLKDFFKYIFKDKYITMPEIYTEIIRIYGNHIPEEHLAFINKIINYNNSFINRIGLAFDKRIKYPNMNYLIRERLAFLNGKR